MGLFSTASPFDADVEKATDEKNTSEEWGHIMDICDKVGSSAVHAKDCLRSIVKRLNHQDPHIVMQAITLLDACASNCGKSFHLEIASRDFETEFRKLLSRSQQRVTEKLWLLLKKWAEGDFKSDSQLSLIPSLYMKLRQEGHEFTGPSHGHSHSLTHTSVQSKKSEHLSKDPNVVNSQQEEDDIAKAIELSLKENSHSPKAQGSLYPSTSLGIGTSATVEARKVRALYDFEAAEDNELTFGAGEIIHVLDDSDPNWWKGYNYKGEGLFPSNFVTADLSAEPEQFKLEQPKKSVQFNEAVLVKSLEEARNVEINELQIDRLLHLLHEADPSEDQIDSQELLGLEDTVNAMGPLIDQELEGVDRKHALLTHLSTDLVDAFSLYHLLMKEPANIQSYHTMPDPGPYGYQQSGPPVRKPAFLLHDYNEVYNGQPGNVGQSYSLPPEQYVNQGQPPVQYQTGGPGPAPRPEDPRLNQSSVIQPGHMSYPGAPSMSNYGPPSFHPAGPLPGQGVGTQGPAGTALHYSPSGRLL